MPRPDEQAQRPIPPDADENTVRVFFDSLGAQFDKELADSRDVKSLRDHWLGRKHGICTSTNTNWLQPAPRELKPFVGRLQNQLKTRVEQAIEERARGLASASVAAGAELDVTLPGPERWIGARHPIRIVQEEIEGIFRSMGYSTS
ncbi:MAG: hypothetical protein HY236_05830, partial [Acidobacteria bacterium]|nr:hypothetical protein [Acidobacteriota bacterium]